MKPLIKLFCCIYCFCCTGLSVAADDVSGRNVLVLVENDMDSMFSLRLQRSIAESIPEAKANIHIHEIPADYQIRLEREGPGFNQFVIEALRTRFSYRQMFSPVEFDEIIAEGSSSGRFLEQNPELFPGAERSFFHILWQPKTGKLYPSDLEPAKSFDAILRAFPHTKHIVFFHFVSRAYEEKNDPISNAFLNTWHAHYSDQFGFEIINLHDDEEKILDRVQHLPQNTAAVYLFFRDARPIRARFDTWVKQQKTIPIFGLFEDSLQDHVGGAVISSDRLASAIISKAEQGDISGHLKRITQLVYNYDALTVWGIEPEALGNDVTILGKPDDTVAWETVLNIIGGAGIVFALLAVILVLQQRQSLSRARVFGQSMTDASERQLQLTNRLRIAREQSGIGEWSWTKHDDVLAVDTVAAKILGAEYDDWQLEDSQDLTSWRDHILPEDLPSVDEFLHVVHAGLKASSLDFRMQTSFGNSKILQLVGANAIVDDDGQIIGVHGLITDITDSSGDRRQLETELRQLRDTNTDAIAALKLTQKAIALGNMGQVSWNLMSGEIVPSAIASTILDIPNYKGEPIPSVGLLFSKLHSDDVAAVLQRLDTAKRGNDSDLLRFRVISPSQGEYSVSAVLSAEYRGGDQPSYLKMLLYRHPVDDSDKRG